MNINYRDKSKPITAEDLIRRYNLDGLAKDRKAIQTNKNGLDKTDTLLNEFVSTTTQSLQELQDQVDGKMTTWFFSGVPTLENQPANEWITEETKKSHIGDLYYDKDTGKAYRWIIDNNEYIWLELSDNDLAEVLAIANSAKDTADSKRRVFVEIPTPPYDVGDIWIKEDTDLYRCRASRSDGVYSETDWILATNYTDDSYALSVEAILNQFKNEVKTDYATKVQLETTADSINANVKTNTAEIRNITETTKNVTAQNVIQIDDAIQSNAIEYNIFGKSEQNVTTKYNLITKQGFSTPKNDTSFWSSTGANFTPLTDGWCRQDYDGTQSSRWSNTFIHASALDVKPATNYTLFFEVRNSTNNLSIQLNDVNYNGMFTLNFGTLTNVKDGIYKYNLTTVSDLTGKYFRVFSDSMTNTIKGSVEYRAMIIEGHHADENIEYKSYTLNSPTSENQSEIKTINGIRNWFDFEKTENYFVVGPSKIEKIENGIKVSNVSGAGTSHVFSEVFLSKNDEMLGKTFTLSCKCFKNNSNQKGQIRIYWLGANGWYTNEIMMLTETGGTFSVPNSMPSNAVGIVALFYADFLNDNSLVGDYCEYTDILLEEGNEKHNYVPFGRWLKLEVSNSDDRKEILINMDKSNLINDGYFRQGTNQQPVTNRVSFISNITYPEKTTFKIKNNSNFMIGTYIVNPEYGNENLDNSGWLENKEYIFTSTKEGYLGFNIKKNDDSDITPKEILKEYFEIYDGVETYHEICSLQDVKDEMKVSNGNLIKKTKKIILNGSENWVLGLNRENTTRFVLVGAINDVEKISYNYNCLCNRLLAKDVYNNDIEGFFVHYPSNDTASSIYISLPNNIAKNVNELKQWLSVNNLIIYYTLENENIYELTKKDIPLFQNFNKIELFESIETDTSIEYYRNTPLSATYVTKSDMETSLNINNNYIEAKVTSKINANYTKTQEQMEILEDNTNNLANRIENNETNLANNYYSKENIEQLLITSSNGLTNTFSEAGGNNIFRNTNFSAKEVLELGQKYEYWYGDVVKSTNNNSVNGNSILLQSGNLNQETIVANGTYTISFYYKKINPLSNCYVKINNKQYELSNDTYSLFQTGVKDEQGVYITEPIIVNDNHLKIEFITDINNSCEIYDIMCNFGSIKLAYSQNQNETVTDTVNISKGITITSSESEVKFTANNDGIRTKTLNNEVITKFTDKGLDTKEATIKEEATIVGILRQKVGEQVWDSLI